MFYKSNRELQSFIEKIQLSSMASLGIDSDDFEKRIHGDKKFTFKGGQLDSNQESVLKKTFEGFELEDFYMAMPEHHYDTSFEYYRFMHTCNITKFDNPNFLARFCNLLPLCHSVFGANDAGSRRNILVTSLPFLNINGVCASYDERTSIVFLNEGLLSIIPSVYQLLLPMLDETLFGPKKDKNSLDKILQIITSSQFFKKSFGDIKSIPEVEKPHAKERWYFQESLRENIKNNLSDKSASNENKTSFRGHPSNFPFTSKMGHFYACRGAYTFLLGHEFSHAYQDHCLIRNTDGLNLRPDDFFNQIDEKIKFELSKYPDLSPVNRNFCVNQPTEEEADAHGLFCVAKYCADNNLDDQRTMCAFVGAVSLFLVMEILEHIKLIGVLGAKESTKFLNIDPIVRNMIFGAEHPVPITRLSMALQHDQFVNSPLRDILSGLNLGLSSMSGEISTIISQQVSLELEGLMNSSELINANINEFINPEWSLGATDLGGKNYLAVKEYFKSRKATSNVVDLFSKK